MLLARWVSRSAGLPAELVYLTVTSTGLDNTPPASVIPNLRRLNATLQAIQKHAGPLVVTSGYRSPAVNAAIGGVPGSLHCQGRAADIKLQTGAATAALFDTMRSDPAVLPGVISELILYQVDGQVSHLHVGIPEAGLSPAPTIQIVRRSA